ncbi:MAG TPA: OB-fold domain-containing protein [Steroidobacteraceae bacterium]|nr:OB-fold domain-containing protein [Steroidobacteraceae bacterium]
MTSPVAVLLPDVSAPLTAPFWQAARKRRFIMQRCAGCGELRWPPKPLCPACLRPAALEDWQDIARTGQIWSFCVYHRAFHPSFADRIPYNVAYIKLDAGPMFISNVVDTNELAIGRAVEARFDDVTPDVTLIRFQLLPIREPRHPVLPGTAARESSDAR